MITNFKQLLTVKEAADTLGVSVVTLHRWDAKGQLKSIRHPINNYRLYNLKDLERLLDKLQK